MNTLQSYQSLEAYRSHDLSIQMRTSSGDTISLGLSNSQQLSWEQSRSGDSGSESLSFASMASYQFHMESNGIDEQDEKEIRELMQIAQPYIDGFMQELGGAEERHSPMNQIARSIGTVFSPLDRLAQESRDFAKDAVVGMVDSAFGKYGLDENAFAEAQTFLDKLLQEMESFERMLYA